MHHALIRCHPETPTKAREQHYSGSSSSEASSLFISVPIYAYALCVPLSIHNNGLFFFIYNAYIYIRAYRETL